MVINISVQYNGGFLPDIVLLTQNKNTKVKYFSPTFNFLLLSWGGVTSGG